MCSFAPSFHYTSFFVQTHCGQTMYLFFGTFIVVECPRKDCYSSLYKLNLDTPGI